MANISIEIKEEYKQHLELLKQIIPSSEGTEIKEDGEMVEALIDSFMAFIQEQSGEHEHGEGGCCGGGSCGSEEEKPKHEHKEGGCGCSH